MSSEFAAKSERERGWLYSITAVRLEVEQNQLVAGTRIHTGCPGPEHL